jgi:hypothetical protein
LQRPNLGVGQQAVPDVPGGKMQAWAKIGEDLMVVDHAPVGKRYLLANKPVRKGARQANDHDEIQQVALRKKPAFEPIHIGVQIVTAIAPPIQDFTEKQVFTGKSGNSDPSGSA